MIRSFQGKEAKEIWRGHHSRQLPNEIQQAARRKLRMLNNSHSLADITAVKGNRLEKLAGDRQEYYSIRITRQWRICFRWSDGDAYEVHIVDYH